MNYKIIFRVKRYKVSRKYIETNRNEIKNLIEMETKNNEETQMLNVKLEGQGKSRTSS
jgi:hypothetical protein